MVLILILTLVCRGWMCMPDNEKAVAVKYNMGEFAPRVIAKGKGYLADYIKRIAEKHNIRVEKDQTAAENLYDINIDQFVPEKYFALLAEILKTVYSLDK